MHFPLSNTLGIVKRIATDEQADLRATLAKLSRNLLYPWSERSRSAMRPLVGDYDVSDLEYRASKEEEAREIRRSAMSGLLSATN